MAIFSALFMVLASGCISEEPDNEPLSKTDEPAVISGDETMEFKVLVFNIEYGGDETTDKVIRALDADVVGVLESYNRLPEIAANTGYPYFNLGLQILSKFPILEPSGAHGLYAFIEVQPGYVVALFNAHLDYVQFGPMLLNEGMPIAQVMVSENEVRASSMRILIPHMQKLVQQGFPVILTGDFNEPSSLDYTQKAVEARWGTSESVPWPVSEALFGIGMRDTFREIHPDPVEKPAQTHLTDGDRIDYVYAGGPVITVDSSLVGEPGGSDVDLSFDPWTSDHRAVLSALLVTPVSLPTTVSLDRRMLTVGETLDISYHAPGNSRISIVIVPDSDEVSPVTEFSLNAGSGEFNFDTSLVDPGGYTVIMHDMELRELARNSFYIRPLQTRVEITSDKSTYKAGEPIKVTWNTGPANRWDWIAVYRKTEVDVSEDNLLIWGYTGGHDSGVIPPKVFGQLTLGEKSQGSPWPLPAGAYRIHYLLTDQYESAAYVDVIVQ